MRAMGITGLLVGAVVLAGCTERSATTAPSASAAALSSAGSIGDRPYTWSLKCSGDGSSDANWSWTAGGVPIAGTGMAVTCDPRSSPIGGSGTRPAAADGFSACINPQAFPNHLTCETWSFDPASLFKAQLKASYKICFPNGPIAFSAPSSGPKCSWFTGSATLNVDS